MSEFPKRQGRHRARIAGVVASTLLATGCSVGSSNEDSDISGLASSHLSKSGKAQLAQHLRQLDEARQQISEDGFTMDDTRNEFIENNRPFWVHYDDPQPQYYVGFSARIPLKSGASCVIGEIYAETVRYDPVTHSVTDIDNYEFQPGNNSQTTIRAHSAAQLLGAFGANPCVTLNEIATTEQAQSGS